MLWRSIRRFGGSIHVRACSAACAAALFAGLTLFATSAPAQTSDDNPGDGRMEVAERVIVHFRVPGVSQRDVFFSRHHGQKYRAFERIRRELAEALRQQGAEVLRHYDHVPALVLAVDPDSRERLAEDDRILSVEPDTPAAPHRAESVPLIGADVTVSNGHTGAGEVIAILDTNVKALAGTALDGVVTAEVCFSTNDASQGVSSLCPSGTGFDIGPGAAFECPNAVSGCGHGTRVARIANAVAPDAEIYAVKVFSQYNFVFGSLPHPACAAAEEDTPCVLSLASDQIAALEWVLNTHQSKPVAAANLSLGGGGFSSPCGSGIRALLMLAMRGVGIAPVVSSGNDSLEEGLSKPACAPAAISVGSSEDGSNGTTVDAVSDFSNSAWFLDLLAPGEVIGGDSGTSFAAPHVAGAFAVMRAIDPSTSVDEILGILQSTGVPVTDSRNNRVTPRLQLDDAVFFLDGPRALPYLPASVLDIFGPGLAPHIRPSLLKNLPLR